MNSVINQARSVFDGSIQVKSDIDILETDNNDRSDQSEIDFFMSIKTSFNDEFVDIPFSQHQSSLYQLMRWVSSGLFSNKNRTNTLEASINITNKTPFEYIPDAEILNNGGLHTLKFTILSDNGCTFSVASDSILKGFTPSIIDSKNMNVVNLTGTSEIAVNKYRHEFMTDNGSRFAAIDSIDKEYFSQSVIM